MYSHNNTYSYVIKLTELTEIVAVNSDNKILPMS